MEGGIDGNKKSSVEEQKKKEVSIIEGLTRILEKKPIGKLTDQEKVQFDKARFAEEQAKKTSFILGGCINRSY